VTNQGPPDSHRWRCCVDMLVLLVSLSLLTGGTRAAERSHPFLIGALTESWGPTPQMSGLRDGLLALGYRENEQFVLGIRFTQGDLAALPTAARELVEYGSDLIFVTEENPAQAAKLATTRIPIVFAAVGDPLGRGLIQSFARPGGNVTGVSHLDLDLGGKRLEIFREIVPGLKRVLLPYDAADSYALVAAREYRDAARRLGIVLVEQQVQTQEAAQAIIAQVRKGEVDGILKPRGVSLNIPGLILQATSEQAIPAMFDAMWWVEQGGLASYGPDFYESGRLSARLVDKILKGAHPGEIPVEVNPKIELAINLRVAKALGLTIAPEILYRADRLVR